MLSMRSPATAPPRQPTLPELFGPRVPARRAARCSLVDKLAAFFRAHSGVWIDGRELAGEGGAYAWRTRLSDLRRPPYAMVIENRQRRVRRPDGSRVVVSEYRYGPPDAASQERR